MTTPEWMAKVREHQVRLTALIADYHPAARSKVRDREMANRVVDPMPITAHTAEKACQRVREEIADRHKTDPVLDFETAVKADDVGKITTLLNQTWMGVPESTSCWKIPGFKETVDLIEEMPDDFGPEELEAIGDLHNGDADRDQGTEPK